MKVKFRTCVALLSLLLSGSASAHALYMAVNDNGDGTVSVNAAFSTGGNASGSDIRVEDDAGRVLWRGETGADGSASFRKPAVTYYIILESDQGHSVEEEGPP